MNSSDGNSAEGMASKAISSEGIASTLSEETLQKESESFDDVINDDDSDDVMEGILDDDDDDDDDDNSQDTGLYSASTSPFLKLMPTALAPTPTHESQNAHQPISLMREPRHEKGVDRLLLKVKFPNAGEDEIREFLKRKDMQQHAAQIMAAKKGQLFREQKDHEDAELWKQQQKREQQLKEQQELQLLQQQQQQQQQQQHQLELYDEEEGRSANFGQAINVSNSTSILPRRSLEGTDDEDECDDAVMWQAATNDDDCVDFKSGVDDANLSQTVGSNSMGGDDYADDDEEKQQDCQHRKKSQKKQQRSKSIVEQTRKSISSVFGGASKIFGKSYPLAAADGNALVPLDSMDELSSSVVITTSDNYTESTGDAVSVNTTTGGDNRSFASSKISIPTSQASAITYKVSNIRSPIPRNRSDFDKQTGITMSPAPNSSNSNSEDSSNDEENNKNIWKWLFDRKKNRLLICVFSMIIVVAVIVTVLGVVIGNRRRVNFNNASESSKNQKVDIIAVVEFFPSSSPISAATSNVESPEATTAYPVEDSKEISVSIPSDEDISDEDRTTIESSTTLPPMTTKSPIDTNSPSSAPIAVAPTAVAPAVATTEPTVVKSFSVTNLPTVPPIPTSSPTEQDFPNWVWSEEGEDGDLLEGISGTDEQFGQSIALSEDGQTLVVGAPDALDKSGVVRIYERKDGSWVTVGALEGSNTGGQFGSAVALSADGRVLAVSEPSFNGKAGDKTGSIHTFIYSPFGYVSMGPDIEGDGASDQLGISIALSSDGRRLAAGAPYHDNSNKDRLVSGIARVFDWSVENNKWIDLGSGSIDTPLVGTSDLDWFGWSIDLNDDGSLICVGAPRNDKYGGYVQCFEEEAKEESKKRKSTATRWKQVGETIQNEDGKLKHDDKFGASIRVSRDPSGTRHRVAIGAYGKNSKKARDTGHVVVYEFNPSTAGRGWIRLGKNVLTLENPGQDFRMGFSLDFHEDLLAVGIPGFQDGAGKVQVFEFQKDIWKWHLNPTIFDGVADGSSSYGSAISMTPSGDFAVGSPESNDKVGSVRFYHRKMPYLAL
jgi:hypothetical protein